MTLSLSIQPQFFSHNFSTIFFTGDVSCSLPDFPFPIHRTAKHLRQEKPLYMYLIFAQNSCTFEFSENTAILKRQRINLVVFVSLLPSAASFPITLKAVGAISHRFSCGAWGVGWSRKHNLCFWAAAHPHHSLLFRSHRGHWTVPGQWWYLGAFPETHAFS